MQARRRDNSLNFGILDLRSLRGNHHYVPWLDLELRCQYSHIPGWYVTKDKFLSKRPMLSTSSEIVEILELFYNWNHDWLRKKRKKAEPFSALVPPALNERRESSKRPETDVGSELPLTQSDSRWLIGYTSLTTGRRGRWVCGCDWMYEIKYGNRKNCVWCRKKL